jgi:hypothetical protein
MLPLPVIAAELELVYQTEVFAFLRVKRSCMHLAEERTSLCNERKCGKPFANEIAEVIGSILKEWFHFAPISMQAFLQCKSELLSSLV